MLAYSSIASTVYVTDTSTERSETVPLNFAAAPRNDRRADRVANRSFGVRMPYPYKLMGAYILTHMSDMVH